MGLYESSHPGVKTMKGLHLYHFMMSNCSQRVRFALEEKGLDWQSHHLNLGANEHLTDEYQSINPKGVVPTLVHDGQVVVESNDILAYLDAQFPESRLTPSDSAEKQRMQKRIDTASAAQPAIKALSHELLFRQFRKIGDEELALYEAQAADRDLVEFLREYAENGEAWRARVDAAGVDMNGRLDALEGALDSDAWLSGSSFGLADISWVVNAHRLTQAQYDLSGWPRCVAWYEKVASRPAFDPSINWTP